jgi:hypothetical protein
MPRNTEDQSFHHKEQELVFKEFYLNPGTHKVCPQKGINFAHLHKHSYFEDALWITKKLGCILS